MQPLKTKLLSNLLTPGFCLLCAILLVTLSFLTYQNLNVWQIIVAGLFTLYFDGLVWLKFVHLRVVLLCLLISWFVLFFVHHQISSLTLDSNTIIKVYPDQVKYQGDWLSGIGYTKRQTVLIEGKINKRGLSLLKKGETVLLEKIDGEVNPILPPTNPGEFDYRHYCLSKRIKERLKIRDCSFTTAPSGIMEHFHYWRFLLQRYIKRLPRLLSFFASELILAENSSSVNQEELDNYRDLGVIHLLSISGLHVGIYTLVLTTFCFWCKLTEKEAFIFCSLILTAGIFLSNGQPGFIRASLSYLLGQLFYFKHYQITKADLLGITCIFHLLFIPRLFMNIGAILSYLLAFGLLMTDQLSNFKQACALNLLITPVLLHSFFQINLLTVIFNIAVVPYFNWIVMPATAMSLLFYGHWPLLTGKLEQLLEGMERIIAYVAHSRYGLLTFGQINWWQSILLLSVTILFLVLIREQREKRRLIKIQLWALFLTYLSLFCLIHFPLKGQVSFIDVGQGDSILVTTPFPRHVYLIDTGGRLNFTGHKISPQINRITLPLLKSQGISQIDGLFVSHQDADHVGDVGPLLAAIPIKRLYMAKGLLNNPSFRKRLDGKLGQTKLVELLAGVEVKEHQINFQVVYPFKAGLGTNADSLCLTFRLANRRWLFTGDLGQAGERELIQKTPMQVDYFKLGHHGSKNSSNFDFLKEINPWLVFISAGRHNRFGHPHPETLATLQKLGIP